MQLTKVHKWNRQTFLYYPFPSIQYVMSAYTDSSRLKVHHESAFSVHENRSIFEVLKQYEIS